MKRLTALSLLIAVALTFSGCKKMGFGSLNLESPLEATEEEKNEALWWDNYTGRRMPGHESKAWKDFYKAPNTDDTRPDYCGFWGNCAGDVGVSESQKAQCNFYGNCKDTQVKSSWW